MQISCVFHCMPSLMDDSSGIVLLLIGQVMYIADQNSLRILTEGRISNLRFYQTLFMVKVEVPVRIFQELTPARTLSISGLKSRVMKLSILSLKMMVKSGQEFILKLTEPLQRYLLSCQANSAILGRYFCTGQQQL